MSVEYVKHLAIAVKDVDAALAQYQRFLGVGLDAKPRDLVKGGSREAHFMFGDVQIQLCQSFEPDHRFAQLHRPAWRRTPPRLPVGRPTSDESVEMAVAAGAILKECKSCEIIGIHEHPEGWIAFLEGDSVPGMEIEFMQVYKEGEMPERFKKPRTI